MANYPTQFKFDSSSSIQHTVRTTKSEFGDGYQMVVPDGVNYIVRNGTITHRFLSIAEASTLRNFLRANCGTSTQVIIRNYFEDPTGSQTMTVYLESWSEVNVGILYNFSIKFREAF